MKSVFYLSYSDIPEKPGLIFPNELQINSYSPGIWVVAAINRDFPNEFEFDVVHINELFTLMLTRVNNSIYQVNTEKFGRFYFRISTINFRYENYVGVSNLIKEGYRLYQVTAIDTQKLEKACEDGFFFVGRIDRSLENKRT